MAGSPGQLLVQRQRRASLMLPPLRPSASAPSLPSSSSPGAPRRRPASGLPPTEELCSKRWTTESKRLLHQRRERHWLRGKAKHRYIDFSDSERVELRRYFDELADGRDRVNIEMLESMLISLGLAEDRQEVAAIVEEIDPDRPGELDFEQYLELVRSRADSNMFHVFKAMMEGKLGDHNLNFQTVISSHRRQLLLDAIASRGATGKKQEFGYKILNNFAALQRGRHQEAARAVEEQQGETPTSAAAIAAETNLPFDIGGRVPTGGPLGIIWRGVCHEHSLVSSRPSSAESRSRPRRTLQPPPSPREVVDAIVKSRGSKCGHRRGTVIVRAPELEEDARPSTSKDLIDSLAEAAARPRRRIAE